MPSVLNVGGGSKALAIPDHYKGWDHLLLDIDPKRGVDLVCDARELSAKFNRETYEAVYCAHNLEHYYRHDVDRVLKGFLHVLRQDGFAEIRVPDIGGLLRLMASADLDLENEIYKASAGGITALDMIYGYGPEIEESGNDFYAHKTGFSRESLARVLLGNGFSEIFFVEPMAVLELRVFAFKRSPEESLRTLLGLKARYDPPRLEAIALRNGMLAADSRVRANTTADEIYANAMANWREGKNEEALKLAEKIISINGALAAPRYLAGSCKLLLGRFEEAASEFAACRALHPDYPLNEQARVHQALALSRRDLARGKTARTLALDHNAIRAISVIICSIDIRRFEKSRQMFDRLLAGVPHEIIGIHDARSLAEGYGRGVAQAHNEIVLFAHDDVEILSIDFAARLLAALAQHDVVGVAGTSRIVGGAWHFAGHPHLRGQVGMPVNDGWVVTVYGAPEAVSGGLKALDGLLLACRKELARKIGFDSHTFDSWHLYDMDFTLRAAQAGLDCATCNDILVSHGSQGNYGESWLQYAERFIAKHDIDRAGGVFHQPVLVSAELQSPQEWQLMTEHLIALNDG